MQDGEISALLPAAWRDGIREVVERQPGVEQFLGHSRPFTLPKHREDTFRALQLCPEPQAVRVVVFGQDPYPRPRSACGIAFCDAAVQSWRDPFSPSFRNIVKNLLISHGPLTPRSSVAEVRAAAHSLHLPPPPLWFEELQREGVLWLNTSLTFTSTAQFWRPVLREIIRTLLVARGARGIVFVLWGGYAHKLRPLIEEVNQSLPQAAALEFVACKHPAVEAFHEALSFKLVDEALQRLGGEQIVWLPSLEKDSQGTVARERTDPSTTHPRKKRRER